MHTEQTANELIIRETPGCLWIVGLFFAFVGGVFAYGSLGGLTDYDSHSAWMLALSFGMGAIAVAVGVWILYNAPITKIVVNRIENIVSMTRYGLFGKQETFYDFDDIKYFCLTEDVDDEGSPVWYFAIKLDDGETIKITSLASHSETYERQYVFTVNEFMRKQIPATQMVFALEDENDAEMR